MSIKMVGQDWQAVTSLLLKDEQDWVDFSKQTGVTFSVADVLDAEVWSQSGTGYPLLVAACHNKRFGHLLKIVSNAGAFTCQDFVTVTKDASAFWMAVGDWETMNLITDTLEKNGERFTDEQLFEWPRQFGGSVISKTLQTSWLGNNRSRSKTERDLKSLRIFDPVYWVSPQRLSMLQKIYQKADQWKNVSYAEYQKRQTAFEREDFDMDATFFEVVREALMDAEDLVKRGFDIEKQDRQMKQPEASSSSVSAPDMQKIRRRLAAKAPPPPTFSAEKTDLSKGGNSR